MKKLYFNISLRAMIVALATVLLPAAKAVAQDYYNFEVDGLRFAITNETDSTCELVYNPDTFYPGDIVIPSKVKGYTVTAIGFYSFYACYNTTSIVIPNTVTTLGPSTFLDCGVKELNLPASVVNIYGTTFGGNKNLKAINVDPANPVFKSKDGVLYKGNYEALMLVPSKYAGDNGVFRLPETTWAMAGAAFENCTELTEIYLTDNVTYMEASMFFGCKNVKTIQMPSKITKLGPTMFNGCKSLVNVNIPAGVKKMDFGVFSGCESLKSVELPEAVDSLEWNTFKNCKSLTNVKMSSKMKGLGMSCFEGCESLTQFTLPESLYALGDGVFTGCKNLTEFNVSAANPNFYANDGVLFRTQDKCLIAYPMGKTATHYDIPEGTETVGESAFRGCSLKSVNFPSTLWYIDNGFVYCDSLESVNLNKVEEIGNTAFYGCKKLKKVLLPATVTHLAKNAFGKCDFDEVVSLATTPPVMAVYEGWFGPEYLAFSNDTYSSAKLTVPAGSLEAYKAANGWNQFVNVETAGVDNISVDGDTAEQWYTLGGVQLEGRPAAAGLYLRRTANGISKVAVK